MWDWKSNWNVKILIVEKWRKNTKPFQNIFNNTAHPNESESNKMELWNEIVVQIKTSMPK